MKKHRFDPLSFIFGLLFLLGGLPLLISSSGLDFLDSSWVFPAFLVIAGVIVLTTAQFSKRTSDDEDDPFRYQDPTSG